ncbi:MAG: hypothetical protein M3R55_10390, partial [Acidobacteriota bacterium]|nr:hypothetical protein [Acidobacteriota bacterium]
MIPPVANEDRRNFSVRLIVMKVAIILIFSAQAVAFWMFQVARHDEFAQKADANHLRTIALRAPRGMLLDRDGQVMVENHYSSYISVMREQTHDIDATLRQLAEVTGADLAAMQELVRRRKDDPVFRPISVIENASQAQVARVLARMVE